MYRLAGEITSGGGRFAPIFWRRIAAIPPENAARPDQNGLAVQGYDG
jgi:hypothetical protein